MESKVNKKTKAVIMVVVGTLLTFVIIEMSIKLVESHSNITKTKTDNLMGVGNKSYFEYYDDKYVSGVDCKAAVSLYSTNGFDFVKFKAKGSDLESTYEDVADFYCLPKKSLDTRVFESSLETDGTGDVTHIVFTLKEPLKDRVSYSVNFNQLNTRSLYKGRLITNLGYEAIYNELTHCYITDNPDGYREDQPTIDLNKLYDVYELLNKEDYLRIGYYLKESEVQHE